ncbi:MAG: hypothetical protein ACPGXL_00075 [Chitinophagales bacterium]
MMKEQFLDAITDLNQLDDISLESLQRVVAEFPYFQTAHILLAKKAQQVNAPNYDSIVSHTASNIGDRAMLYQILHQNYTTEHLLPNDLDQDALAVIANQRGLIDDAKIAVENEPSMVVTPIRSTPTAEIKTEQIPEEARKRVLAELSRRKTEVDAVVVEPFDQNNAVSAVVPAEQVEKVRSDVEKDLEKLRTKQEAEINVDLQKSVEADKSMLESLQEKVDAYNEKQNSDEPAFNLLTKEQDEISSYMNEHFTEREAPIDLSTDEIEEQAQASLSTTGLITSEAIAQVYEDQGLFKEAVEIYEQLGLKNPEKKRYFASQIERLKSKL